MKNYCFLILLGIVLIQGCSFFYNTDQQNIRNNELEPIWSHDFDIGYFASIKPVIFEDKVIFSALDSKREDFSANSTLEALGLDSGIVKWRWEENIPNTYDKFSSLDQNFVFNGKLYISSGWEYIVDLNTGRTVDENNSDKYEGVNFYRSGENLYSLFSALNQSYESLEKSNLNQFDWEIIFSKSNNDSIQNYFRFLIFDEQFGYLPYVNSVEENSIRIMKFDKKSNKVLSENIIEFPFDDFYIDFLPQVVEDYIFFSLDGHFASINKNDFSIKWVKDLYGHSSRSGFTVNEDAVYINTEFYLYKLDAKTGNQLWRIESTAGSTLSFHDGVLYYIDNSKLIGIDPSTGAKLLDFYPPSYEEDRGAFFQPVLTIDHENDRIYTASYTHAYCYPTLN